MVRPKRMELDKKITFICNSEHCEFRSINENDVTEAYIEGLKNQRKYLENKPASITIESQKYYINNIVESEYNTICGLFINSVLVGTAGIQNITTENKTTIGIFIFNKNLKGRGLGKTLVWASCYLLKNSLGIEEFGAGMEKTNIPSLKSFLACGFDLSSEDEVNYMVKLNIENLQQPSFISKVQIK